MVFLVYLVFGKVLLGGGASLTETFPKPEKPEKPYVFEGFVKSTTRKTKKNKCF